MTYLMHANVQMYADDCVMFTSAKSIQDASATLTSAMIHVQDWLKKSCLSLNTKKTMGMMFTKSPVEVTHSNVFLGEAELDIVNEFKYLGVTLDSTLTFKSHVKNVTNTVKFNIENFRQIRPCLPVNAARMFLHSMIFSHIEYCFINWSLSYVTTLTPI